MITWIKHIQKNQYLHMSTENQKLNAKRNKKKIDNKNIVIFVGTSQCCLCNKITLCFDFVHSFMVSANTSSFQVYG